MYELSVNQGATTSHRTVHETAGALRHALLQDPSAASATWNIESSKGQSASGTVVLKQRPDVRTYVEKMVSEVEADLVTKWERHC